MNTTTSKLSRITRIFNAGILTSFLVGMPLFTTFAHAQAQFVQDGHAGFVVSNIEYALANDADQTGACPEGMTGGFPTFEEVTATYTKGREGDPPTAEERRRLLIAGFPSVDGKNLCMHPELGESDPDFKTVSGPNVPVYGIDLDGRNSKASDTGFCPHDDFSGLNGEAGIDNQFFRVVGCSPSFQSTGQSNTFGGQILTGSWGILITLDGVEDIVNDAEVEVGFYANADPMQLSPDRTPLPYSTYAIDQDPRFRAKAMGKIVNGMLITEPTDMNFEFDVNSIVLERPVHEARVQLQLNDEGELEGYLAGYVSVEEAYDMQYGFRNGLTAGGSPAPLPLKLISSNGQAAVQGHSCHGAYFALAQHADAHPDPDTGKCSWLSIQYRLNAIPAFVLDVETESSNQDLVK